MWPWFHPYTAIGCQTLPLEEYISIIVEVVSHLYIAASDITELGSCYILHFCVVFFLLNLLMNLCNCSAVLIWQLSLFPPYIHVALTDLKGYCHHFNSRLQLACCQPQRTERCGRLRGSVRSLLWEFRIQSSKCAPLYSEFS